MAKQVSLMNLITNYQKELDESHMKPTAPEDSVSVAFPITIPALVADDLSLISGQHELSFVAIQLLQEAKGTNIFDISAYEIICRCFILLAGSIPEHLIRVSPSEEDWGKYCSEFKTQLAGKLEQNNLTDLVQALCKI